MCNLSLSFMTFFVLSLLGIVQQCHCFTLLAARQQCRVKSAVRAGSDDDDISPNNDDSVPQLPAIGESSFGSKKPSSNHQEPLVDGEKRAVAFVSDKFELQYTCKICDTKNSHRVSRLAYRNGVVITVCKGCDSQHLIADNLGWTDYDGGFEGDTNTIEDYFVAKGKADYVNRVSQDVFNLEQLLDIQTDSGSIIGEDGKPAME